jgi:WD40 repeat protein
MLVTVDREGTIASWPLALASTELGRPLGRTASPASVSASADGRRIAFTRPDGAVQVFDAIAGAELYRLRLARALPVTQTQLSADGTELVTQSAAELKTWRLPAKAVTPRAATVDVVPTALALDRTSDVVAVGLASGQLQLMPAGSPVGAPLSFFGHRGGITAAALNGRRGLAATGGNDGIVRVWELDSGAPTGTVAQPADAPVAIVALSSDGQYVASAAAGIARAATIADGRVLTEVQVQDAVTALAFAPDAVSLAVGDATGAVVIAGLAPDAGERVSVQLGAAATSLAFTPDGRRLAAGDAGGVITFIATADGDVEGTARHWSQPIRWLESAPDGNALLVATDAWLHVLAAIPALAPTHSKLMLLPASSTALIAVSGTAVRFAGVETNGALVSGIIDVAAPANAAASAAELVARDWSAALALRLNDDGEPVPVDP